MMSNRGTSSSTVHRSQNAVTAADLPRQIIVAVSAVIAIVGSFIGSGALIGTPIEQAAGGALAADATVIAPAGSAFSIWSVIYIGLVAYAIWQFLPAQQTEERHRRLSYPVAASLILNAAWILSIQFDLLLLSVPVIVVLLAVLVWNFLITLDTRPTNIVDAIVTDGTLGLYLGWVSIATVANVAAVLKAYGFEGFGISPDVWGIVLLVVATVVGVLLAVRGAGRIAPMLSLAWGIVWIAVGRLTNDLMSTPVAVAAIIAAVIIVVTTIALRVAIGRRFAQSRGNVDRVRGTVAPARGRVA